MLSARACIAAAARRRDALLEAARTAAAVSSHTSSSSASSSSVIVGVTSARFNAERLNVATARSLSMIQQAKVISSRGFCTIAEEIDDATNIHKESTPTRPSRFGSNAPRNSTVTETPADLTNADASTDAANDGTITAAQVGSKKTSTHGKRGKKKKKGSIRTVTSAEGVIGQVEYYFSELNLPHDSYMLKFMGEEKTEGWLPLEQLMTFPKIKSRNMSVEELKDALGSSTLLEINDEGTALRRRSAYFLSSGPAMSHEVETSHGNEPAFRSAVRMVATPEDLQHVVNAWKDRLNMDDLVMKPVSDSIGRIFEESFKKAGEMGDQNLIVSLRKDFETIVGSEMFDVASGPQRSLIAALASCGDIDGALDLLDANLNRGMRNTPHLWTSVINGAAHAGDLKQAKNVFAMMRQHGIEPDIVTYNVLLKACGVHDFNEANSIMDEILSKEDTRPNSFTFRVVVNMARHDGDCGKSMELLKRIDSAAHDQEITDEMYLLAARIMSRSGDPNITYQLIKMMDARGRLVSTDMYNMCILTCKNGSNKSERAAEIFHEMRARGVPRNAFTYDMLLADARANYNFDAVIHIFNTLQEDQSPGLEPDIVSYNCLLEALAKRGDLKQVMAVLKRMNDVKINLNWRAIYSKVYAVGMTSGLDEALKLHASVTTPDFIEEMNNLTLSHLGDTTLAPNRQFSPSVLNNILLTVASKTEESSLLPMFFDKFIGTRRIRQVGKQQSYNRVDKLIKQVDSMLGTEKSEEKESNSETKTEAAAVIEPPREYIVKLAEVCHDPEHAAARCELLPEFDTAQVEPPTEADLGVSYSIILSRLVKSNQHILVQRIWNILEGDLDVVPSLIYAMCLNSSIASGDREFGREVLAHLYSCRTDLDEFSFQGRNAAVKSERAQNVLKEVLASRPESPDDISNDVIQKLQDATSSVDENIAVASQDNTQN